MQSLPLTATTEGHARQVRVYTPPQATPRYLCSGTGLRRTPREHVYEYYVALVVSVCIQRHIRMFKLRETLVNLNIMQP